MPGPLRGPRTMTVPTVLEGFQRAARPQLCRSFGSLQPHRPSISGGQYDDRSKNLQKTPAVLDLTLGDRHLRRHGLTYASLGTLPPFAPARTRSSSTKSQSEETAAEKLKSRDRGPVSQEDTQTDFGALDVLANTATPSTSVDICYFDGFQLDSGLRISDGDGVMLVGAEAFVWRPWMAASAESGTKGIVTTGEMLRGGKGLQQLTGGVVNGKGQFEFGVEAMGILQAVWPKPDLLIIGTGPTIRPLAPSTRRHIQDLGMRLEVLDTRNAASQFNLLATERGLQDVAAAMVPLGFGSE